MAKIQTTEEAIAIAEAAFSDPDFNKLEDASKEKEDNKQQSTKDEYLKKDEVAVTEEKQETGLSDFEQEQKALGWNPDGEKSAKEWAAAYPVYTALKERNQEVKQYRRVIDEMKQLLATQKQTAYNQALADLAAERNAAITNGDHNAVNEIDRKRATIQPLPVLEPEAVAEFKEKHAKWLTGTSFEEMEMSEFAKRRDAELMGKKLSPEDHMELLEQHVKAKFPNYFKAGKTQDSQAVEGSSGANVASRSKARYTFQDLSEEQKKVAKDFERLKVMKIDQYINELAAAGEIRK